MKYMIVITAFLFLITETALADSLFITTEVSGKLRPEITALSGQVYDTQYDLYQKQVDQSSYMPAAGITATMWIGNFLQVACESRGAYAGNYIEPGTWIDSFKENDKTDYHLFETSSNLMGRIFIGNSIFVSAGAQYQFIKAIGSYQKDAVFVSKTDQTDSTSVRRFEYRQKGIGYRAGIGFVPNILRYFALNISAYYTYIPNDNGSMVFNLIGETNRRNESHYSMTNYEVTTGLRIQPPVDGMIEIEAGIRTSYSRYRNKYDTNDGIRLFEKDSFSYREYMPYIKIVSPVY